LFHTIRYLRPIQIIGRLWFRIYSPSIKEQKALPLRSLHSPWLDGLMSSPSMSGSEQFHFLNKDGELLGKESWNDPFADKLWLYNLHYFDDLNANHATERVEWHRALIHRWIEENPPVFGNGWESYPVSLRVVNWIKWSLQGNEFEEAWHDSLVMQVRYLKKRLEYHLLGNHLFANAKALVFAGLYFSGEEAEEWLEKGLGILEREIPEQVLEDGGHFERSPMYHCIILEDILDLINVTQVYGMQDSLWSHVAHWKSTAQRMRHWLGLMCHPDKEISFFNDATLGVAPTCIELEAYADHLGLEKTPKSEKTNKNIINSLSDSGYIRIEKDNVVMLLDVGVIGPDYLPGHAHADTLSFELSLFNKRVIVNSGISCYGNSEERLRQRGTAAHSTVELNNENSSEVWSGFRVARRARPFDLKINEKQNEINVSCSHDGYRRLAGKPVHQRTWDVTDDGLLVTDRIEGEFIRAIARFYLHPDVIVKYDQVNNIGALEYTDRKFADWSVSDGVVNILDTTYHSGFGLDVSNKMIEIVFNGSEIKFNLNWKKQ
jgi:uncharacterized heparinase superfamily protein